MVVGDLQGHKWKFPKIRGPLKGVYRVYIGILEKKMETTV